MATNKDILDQIKKDSQSFPPGILPPGKTMDSLIGHTVINISDTNLDTTQIEALQKGLTFCPTLGPPTKSWIWKDFKAFHRRLVLQHHFYNDNNILNSNDRELVSILVSNLDSNENPYHHIHSKFRPKSNWMPNNTPISLKNPLKWLLKITYYTKKVTRSLQITY